MTHEPRQPSSEDEARQAKVAAFRSILPQLIARGELALFDAERGRSGTPEETQKKPDVLLLRGMAQVHVAKTALDRTGLRPDIYGTLERTIDEDKARTARLQGEAPLITMSVNVSSVGAGAIEDKLAVTNSLGFMYHDPESLPEEREAAAGLLKTLGSEAALQA